MAVGLLISLFFIGDLVFIYVIPIHAPQVYMGVLWRHFLAERKGCSVEHACLLLVDRMSAALIVEHGSSLMFTNV